MAGWIRGLVDSVPNTSKSERAEVVSIPNRAVADVYKRIVEKRHEAQAIDGEIGHILHALDEHRKEAEQRVERLGREKVKLLREMRDDQDIWRRMSTDLGIDVIWPDDHLDDGTSTVQAYRHADEA